MTETTAKHWVDDPISSALEDQFDRAEYAASASELIVGSHTWDSSVVFGLTGPWGSGKSSIVRMISEHLGKHHSSWAVAHFTPWATSDIDGLLAEFYGAISSALPKNKRSSFMKSAAALARIAAPAAKFVPYVGEFVGESAKAAAEIVSGLLSGQQPWTAQFAETSAKLKELGVPVLIVADDIDRLQANELLTLLKIIRLLGRFAGVQYLLAYDDQTVFRALRASSLVGHDSRAAEQFMEKIVQYPLAVPPLLGYQQLKRIASGVAGALDGRPPVNLNEKSDLLEVMVSQLSTPRSIDRFVAQLKHHMPMLPPSEINDSDVIALTVLRVSFPSIYAKLPQWREQLITGYGSELVSGESFIFARTDISALLQDVPTDAKRDAEKLLKSMFPKLDETAITALPIERMRMCDKNYFDRYLAMGVPSNDISNTDAAGAVKNAIEGDDSQLRALVLAEDATRAYLALDRVAEVPLESDSHRLALLSAISRLMPMLSSATAADFFSPLTRARVVLAGLLTQLTPVVKVSNVQASTDALPLSERIRLWSKVRGWGQPWVEALGISLAHEAVDQLIKNAGAGDGGGDDGVIALRTFVMAQPGGISYLVDQAADAISAGTVTPEDLAARFVTQGISGSSPIDEPVLVFERDAWLKISQSSNITLRPLTAGETFDEHDPSWANRRRFAQAKAQESIPSRQGDASTGQVAP